MKIAFLAPAGGILCASALASGNYTGPLRPQIHFSPPQNFMNDPNGCFLDANGTWHLYYQYNPTAIVAGNQHWGHATSPTSTTADRHFSPDATSQVFSGSAVVDANNTSGFFPNQTDGVVAIYTLNTPTKQVQAISYSTDGGYTFTPYAGNPVIDSTSTQFRDPKVLRYADHWVMVVSFATDFTIGIYTSPDLLAWRLTSNFSHHGLLGLQYECPNLVEVPIAGTAESMYLLTISVNPGAPLGGSATQYFPGTFNGTHFAAADGAARLGDFGKDNYAGQFFHGVPRGEAVSIAWASNWQYAGAAPTDVEGWRSAMSLPRRNALTNATSAGWTLTSLPYDLAPVLGDVLADTAALSNSALSVDYSGVPSNALYFEANVTGAPGGGLFNFTFSSPVSGEVLAGGYFFGGDTGSTLFLDRGKTRGLDNPFFTDKVSAVSQGGTWTLAAVLDRSIIEVFLDEGAASGTMTFFPVEPLTVLDVAATGFLDGAQVGLRVWALESVWAQDATAVDPVARYLKNSPEL